MGKGLKSRQIEGDGAAANADNFSTHSLIHFNPKPAPAVKVQLQIFQLGRFCQKVEAARSEVKYFGAILQI